MLPGARALTATTTYNSVQGKYGSDLEQDLQEENPPGIRALTKTIASKSEEIVERATKDLWKPTKARAIGA